MRVQINGETYVPEDSSTRIGIGITTHNRREMFLNTFEQMINYRPTNSVIVIVDDGSDKRLTKFDTEKYDDLKVIRNEKALGVPTAKNQCLEYLMEKGCEHLFLFDDDCCPIKEGWEKPYIDSFENHLSYQFTKYSDGTPVGDMNVIYQDEQCIGYSHQRGCMLYYSRKAIETVGGFNSQAFGMGMEEHLELAQRIYRAGLTSQPYLDVRDSNSLFYSSDEHREGKTSIRKTDKQKVEEHKQYRAYLENKNDTSFIDYRTRRTHIVTSYLTTKINPQSHEFLSPSLSNIKKLVESANNHGVEITTIIDNTKSATFPIPDTNLILRKEVETGWNTPNLDRWLLEWQWLRQNNVSEVWFVDATDVELLNDLPPLKKGEIYCGWEDTTTTTEWIVKNTSPTILTPLLANYPLLNCGVVGGTRETMLEFMHDMVQEINRESHIDIATWQDMTPFNIVCRSLRWRDHINTGKHITTEFKKNERNEVSAWKHK